MKFVFLILFSFSLFQINAQDWDVPKLSNEALETDESYSLKKRKKILLISEASAYTISLVGLNQLWYADYDQNSFRILHN